MLLEKKLLAMFPEGAHHCSKLCTVVVSRLGDEEGWVQQGKPKKAAV